MRVLLDDKDALRVPVAVLEIDAELEPDRDCDIDLVAEAERVPVLDVDEDPLEDRVGKSLRVARILTELETVVVLDREPLPLRLELPDSFAERVTVIDLEPEGLIVDVLEEVVEAEGDRVELTDFVLAALTDELREPVVERLTVTVPVFVLELEPVFEITAEVDALLETDAVFVSDEVGLDDFVASALLVEVLVEVAVSVGKIGIRANSLPKSISCIGGGASP